MLTLEDIRRARPTITPFVRRTPTERNKTLSERLKTNLYLKLELFQATGSFKPRGAFNKMLGLSAEECSRGVVAFSGGNFAQAVAYVGARLGVRTRVIMPADTPQNYLEATRGYGAEVELRESIAEVLESVASYRDQGMAFMHPFDDSLMMAGNGTLGLELLEEVPELTDVIVSIGGGGLMAGVTTAVKALRPEVRVWGVETAGADAMARSLQAGRVVRVTASSIAKTLGAPYVAEHALAVARQHLEGVTVVSDRAAFGALVVLLERAKVFTEPAASCTLAAAERLAAHFSAEHHVALVLCGGNAALGDVLRWRDQFPG